MRFTANKPTTKTRNLAGGKAFRMSAPMELVHAVLSTFLEDKFYETGDARIQRIADLVAKNDPKFVSNLATVARQEFHMRSVVTLLVAELAKCHRGDSLVMETIVRTAQRVDDLIELVSYFKRDKKALPKQVKRGIRNALLKFNRYQLAKYRGEGKTVSLTDVFNLVHPKPKHANEEQKQAWKDLMEGKLASFDTWETEISNSKDDATRTEVWEKLITNNKLGYMALLRNLNNLVKYGVSEKIIARAVAKLTSPVEVMRSKQLPFRYFTAYQHVRGNRQFTDAISLAMDLAVANTPKLEGRTLIAVDASGSMGASNYALGGGSDLPIVKAAIFAATLVKANVNADLILFDTQVKELQPSSRMPVVDLAESIIKASDGGGTETSLVFRYAGAKKTQYDRIVIISDVESWSERDGVQKWYAEYCKATGADPFVYAIDIQGHGTKDVVGSKVFHLAGWSSRLLDFVGQAERGESLVDYIRDYIPMSDRTKPQEETVDESVDN